MTDINFGSLLTTVERVDDLYGFSCTKKLARARLLLNRSVVQVRHQKKENYFTAAVAFEIHYPTEWIKAPVITQHYTVLPL